MDIKCDKCGKKFRDMFETIVRCDYAEPGKGKPYEWHLCIDCRKELVSWFDNKESPFHAMDGMAFPQGKKMPRGILRFKFHAIHPTN